jgi:hypothetical protein
VKSWGLFALLSLALIAAVGALFAAVFRGPEALRAIVVSGAVTWVVQLLTYAMVRFTPRRRVMRAWGAGITLRLLTLVVYAFVVLKVYRLPPEPALLSLAAFLFVSTILETRLLSA